jgi:hypothetical protein
MLRDIGIIRRANKSSRIFDEYCWKYFDTECSPSDYIRLCQEAYLSSPVKKNNSLNGNMFELMISSLCVKEGITPIFLQASVAFVPNVIYDAILYSEENFPVSLSLKTSLRERYKQADLEAVALKYVHRKAKSYLLSLDEKEVRDIKNKINDGSILGINNVICATSDEFDVFVAELKKKTFIKPEKIEIVVAKKVVG